MTANTLHNNFQQSGAGTDVILLHGLGQRLEDWRLQVPTLEQAGYRVLAYDLRGHGRSGWEAGDEPVTIENYADDLEQLVREQGIEQAHLVGLSMGTPIAQTFYKRNPQKVLSMVLAGAFAYFPEPIKSEAIKARLDRLDQGDFEGLAWMIAEKCFTSNAPRALIEETAATIAALDPHRYRASFLASVNSDCRESLPLIKVPVLLLIGEDDQTTPRAFSQFLLENLPDARLEIIPKARHVCNQEQPELFNRHLLDFLAAHTPPPVSKD